jgi:hypothetical protein
MRERCEKGEGRGKLCAAIVFITHGMGVAPPFDKTWRDVLYDFIFNPFPISEAIPPLP